MSWYSIREYTERQRISSSTVRRQIQQGRIYAKKFGRNWYVHYPDSADTGAATMAPPEPSPEPVEDPRLFQPQPLRRSETVSTDEGSKNLQSVVEFSSKALNHYLILNDKLLAEKDIRIAERDHALAEVRQDLAEVQKYVRILENELSREKERRERPEGWQ